jgi:Ca2+-binding RTX toxin-like protein
MGFTPEDLSETQIVAMKANFEGKGTPAPVKRPKLTDGIEARQVESDRVDNIVDIALAACDKRPYDMEAIKSLAEQGIEAKWPIEKFRLELLEASLPPAHTVFRTKGDDRLNTRVLEAAVCMAGKLKDHEKRFDDQTLQAAHDRFPGGIGLKQLFLLAARDKGLAVDSFNVTLDVQRTAFGMTAIQASGFSTINLPTVFSNTANKFLMEGWDAVDMTPLKIAAVRPVSDFKQITTVSLTGDLMFEQVGPDGEIKHGTLGEAAYTNKADTYAKMLAITRTDIINDDLGALTAAPRKLGRGGALKLNDLFWTAFLNNATFFTSARKNVSTDTGELGLLGLEQADTIFMEQTDPDGNPLGVVPSILLAPTTVKSTALHLMSAEKIKGDTDEPDVNIWRDRFRVESSPYMSNAKYTGYSSSAWYLLADPADLPVIEIVALNGRVEPVIETADADFNVLGVQMRGYSDVGVEKQEYRAGVRADGTAAD